MKKIASILAMLLIAGSSWAGDIYRWVDDNGVIRYSDQMPPPSAKNVQKLKSTSGSLTAEKAPVALPPETAKAAEKLPVTLYSFEECGDPCKSAEALLDKRGVPYTLKSSNADKAALKQLTGKLEVPVMVIGNTTPISGFTEERWNKELDLAGYAKSNPNVKPGTSMAIKPAAKEAEATPAKE